MDQRKKEKRIHDILYWSLPVLAIFCVIVAWVSFSSVHPELMPGPAAVIERLGRTFTKPIGRINLLGHAWASLKRVLLALLFAWTFGIFFGILIGWSRTATVIYVTNNIEEAIYLGTRIVLLSKCPASVKAEYTIDLPRPRDMVSDEFMNLRTKISENTDLSV